MTTPSMDPYDPPTMGIGLRAGMFSGALTCPRCGFATSDPNIYTCPNCEMVWREPPKQVVLESGPKAGEKVSLTCIICGKDFSSGGTPVFAGGTDLAHEGCLIVPKESQLVAAPEAPEGYLQVVRQSPRPKRKRNRKRKRRPTSTQVQQLELPMGE